MEGAYEAGLISAHFLYPFFTQLSAKRANKTILQGAEKIVAQHLPKIGEDHFSIELPFFGEEAVALDPKKTASPPKIVHLRFASGEGGRDFMPNLGFRRGPYFEIQPLCPAAKIGLFPEEKIARLEKPDCLRNGSVHQ